jgi:hypothetical protein
MAAALKALQTRLEAEAVSFRDIQKGARKGAARQAVSPPAALRTPLRVLTTPPPRARTRGRRHQQGGGGALAMRAPVQRERHGHEGVRCDSPHAALAAQRAQRCRTHAAPRHAHATQRIARVLTAPCTPCVRCVAQELERLELDAGVFKLIGPVLIRQDLVEARANVSKRLDYIRGERRVCARCVVCACAQGVQG